MNQYLKIIAVLTTSAVLFLIGYLSIEFLGEYGWTVFILLPFLIGFLPAFIVSRSQPITARQSYLLGFATLGVIVLELLIFALEGMICILMASPLLVLMTWLGAFLAYRRSLNDNFPPTYLLVILSFASLAFMSFDYIYESDHLIPVKTSISVDAPIEEVWKNVVTFDTIDQAEDWIFKTGIAYPTHATIVGEGIGAIRYCNFSTGAFVEPITTWDAPHLLQFSVEQQPIPMSEWNPFWEVHPPHLDGYFKSVKGQFALREINERQTHLEGTTWYKVDIAPLNYWRLWSDFIVHQIHLRVLGHIKKESEANSRK